MRKILSITILLMTLVSLNVTSAFACSSTVYYDTNEGSNQTGNATTDNPVADLGTAYNIGINNGTPGTGCIYEINAEGEFVQRGTYIVVAPASGVPLPTTVLYGLLLVLAVGLIITGWWMQRRNIHSSVAPAQG